MQKPDPFADEEKTNAAYDYALGAVKRAERNIDFVETKMSPVEAAAMDADRKLGEVPVPYAQGELMAYTRIADLSDDLSLVSLEEIQGIDLIIWRYDKYHSAENNADFFTLEVSSLTEPEKRFLTNCGGQVAMRKIESAFEKIALGTANPPLVAAFRKILTNSGRSFWVVD